MTCLSLVTIVVLLYRELRDQSDSGMLAGRSQSEAASVAYLKHIAGER